MCEDTSAGQKSLVLCSTRMKKKLFGDTVMKTGVVSGQCVSQSPELCRNVLVARYAGDLSNNPF